MALAGVRVIELAGLAPAPFCGMILADFGAKVIRVDRTKVSTSVDTMGRGKKSVAINLKTKEGVAVLRRLCLGSDVLLEPYRKGEMTGAVTGRRRVVSSRYNQMNCRPFLLCEFLWLLRCDGEAGSWPTGAVEGKPRFDLRSPNRIRTGRSSVHRGRARHQLPCHVRPSVLAGTQRREALRAAEPAGGLRGRRAHLCAGGRPCAAGEDENRERRGHRCEHEGAAYVGSFLWKSGRIGLWDQPRGQNMLDSGAPFYDTYQTSDGKYMAVGAIEPQFYRQLLEGLELDVGKLPPQMSFEDWPELRRVFTERFASKSQAEWSEVFNGTDACVTPVLTFHQVSSHPHNQERASFMRDASGDESPRPAPVLSRTPAEPCLAPDPVIGQNTAEVLREYGFTSAEIDKMQASGAVEVALVKAKL
ncbi:alpha-methylacyl-CoA racemase isoform X1 [Antennarius striatus]|uniref:alpha-methylacyl-CoA racemase isoform X1 n=1 Tax=Antennarius striatus TaxID=241820 RepID=UPI0035B4DA18